jgi:hypothetical protein
MQKKVVKPFLESKYSKIDKKYINQNYNEWIRSHSTGEVVRSKLYQVLTKSEILKKELEDFLDVKISDDAELASKINLTKEIYNYQNDTVIANVVEKFI